MATNYIYEYIPHGEYEIYFATTNDVTLLSNAAGVTDRGQFQYQDTWSTGEYRSTAIDLSGTDNRLTIGGNFTNAGKYRNDDGRYLYGILEDPDSPFYDPTPQNPRRPSNTYDNNDHYNQKYYNDRANVFYRGGNIRDDAAAIRFRNNGVLFLTADTGAGAAHDAPGRDDNLRIVGIADTRRNREYYSDVEVPPVTNNTTISAIEVGDKLTVGGDLSGEIIAEATSFLHGIRMPVSNVSTPTNTTVNQTNVANGIKTGDLVIRNNQRAIISATARADIRAYVRPTISGNTLSAIGIQASGTVTCTNGQWAGEITVANDGNVLDARWNDDEGNIAIVGIGTSDPITHPGVMTGNKLTSIGLNADTIDITEMIVSHVATPKHNISSTSNKNILMTSATGSADTDVTLTFTNNTINTYAINGSAVKIDTVDSAVVLKTASNDNEFSGVISGGKKKTIILSDNHIETTSIKADNFTTSDFQGQISSIANDNYSHFDPTEYGVFAPKPSGNYLSTNGIRVSNTLTSKNNFGGTITVESNDNYMERFQYCETYGINAKSFTVTGRIDTDINVTARNNSFVKFSAVGIGVINDLTADAFSGTILSTSITTYGGLNRLGIGISVQGQIGTSVVNDAFDINGTIKADGFGVLSRGKLNLRVSGTIESGYNAIWAESYWKSETSEIMVDSNLTHRDQVELAHTANITGDIDLGFGENKLIINSNAVMNGKILASGGKMNIQFALDGVAKNGAIVTTFEDDISLTSTATISINLDYAKKGDTYTLFEYDANYSQYWGANKQITFIYRGETKVILMSVGSCTFKDKDGVTTAIAEIEYVGQQVKVKVVEVTVAPEFVDPIISSYDAENRKLILTGFTKLDSIYEVEYTVYDANGISYGNSIVLRVDGLTNDRAVISGINPGDQVRWRVRSYVQAGEKITNWSELTETEISKLHESTDPNLTALLNQVSDAKLFKTETEFVPGNGLTLTLPKAATFQIRYIIKALLHFV